MIEAVKKVTHIAPAGDNGEILGSPMVARADVHLELRFIAVFQGDKIVRLRILSDLHVECFQEGRDLPDVAADVVILAGDHLRCGQS
jgi:hypothetical protein